MKLHDIKSDFLIAMRNLCIDPDCEIIADGKLYRFHDRRDKPGTKNGWYILFSDYPTAGAFGCWKRGISERWACAGVKAFYDLHRRFVLIDNTLAGDFLKGQQLAAMMWRNSLPANGNHQYLQLKQILPHGVRYLNGALLVPVMDINGQLHGLQRIYRDGSKRFISHTNKLRHFYMIGTPNNNVICIAEGFATAATIYEVTGWAVAVAFDAGNVVSVAASLRTIYLQHQIVICADNDRHTDNNIGVKKARIAAEAVNGRLVIPRFSHALSTGSDFNDLYIDEGPSVVRDQILGKGGDSYVSNL